MVQVLVLAVATAVVLVVGGLKCARRKARLVKRDQDFLCGLLPGPVAIGGGDTGVTTVAGRLADGTPVGLELVTDTLTLRRLPRQLLVVRFPARLPGTPVVEVARQAAGFSVYSNEFSGHVAVSGGEIGLPADLIVRFAEPHEVLAAEVGSSVRALFGDARVQRLFLGPHGIRLIYQVGVARADAYRITRRVEISRDVHVDAAARCAIDRAHRVVYALAVTDGGLVR